MEHPSRPHRVPRDPLLWGAMAVYVLVIGVLSLLRYAGYNAGLLDLGSMYQAIASVLRGEPLMLTSPRGNVSRLAGHVELIYYVFAPLVALWPDPRGLLLGQTLLAATGAIPAYRLALRRLDSVLAARCAALIYLLYPVALTAALFDFHGDTLAMPLLLWAIDAFDRRDARAAALWVGLSLLCKVYVAVAVAALGAYLFLWGGQRRAGLITAGAAGLYGALVFLVVRPRFEAAGGVHVANDYINHYFGAPETLLATSGERALAALVVIGPALFLAWRGWRWLLMAAPLIGAVLVSTGPGAGYHYAYHHYALAVPFIVMAAIDGAARLRAVSAAAPPGAKPRRWRADLVFTTVVVGLTSALLVDQPLNPAFWMGLPGQGLDSSAYGATSRDRLKDRFLAAHAPPPAAPIAASMFLAPRLADRDTLYAVRYPDDPGGARLPTLLPVVDYVLADALFDWRTVDGETILGGPAYERAEIALLLRDPAFGLAVAEDGLLRFERNASAPLMQRVELAAINDLPEQTAYFGPVRLLGAELAPLEGRRYRASFAWMATEPLPSDRSLIPVSVIEGVEGRIVHLPTYALLPTATWPMGAIIREEFDLELPADLPAGSYTWRVGWYDPAHPDAYATDERSRFMGAAPATVGAIEVSEAVTKR